MTKHRNFARLIACRKAIEAYQDANDGVFPATRDLVAAGVTKSTSSVGYLLDGMDALGMLVKRSEARSSRLLPLEVADPQVLEYLKAHR